MRLKPDESSCKKCGKPVRYASIGTRGSSYDAEPVELGGFQLEEEEADDGTATGRWIARYVRAAEREGLGFRQHDCRPFPQFDNRDLTPVLIQGAWTLVGKASFK